MGANGVLARLRGVNIRSWRLPRTRHAAGETLDTYRWWVLGVTSIGALLASLSSGTLIIALPDILRDLHNRGRTIVMTTHYMDEADRLCDRLAIIDRGKLLALDTPRALKAKAPGGTLLELVLDGDAMPAAEIAETLEGISRVEAQDGILRAHSTRGGQMLPALIETAESTGRTVTDIHLLQPSLETLFVSLTGRKLG